MLAATREMLIERLLELPGLIDLYQRKEPSFVSSSNQWLTRLEETLQRLRHPLAATVAMERARITSVLEGYREPILGGSRMSQRKALGVVTSLALSQIEEKLVAVVENIDLKFDPWREKLAQFASVASNSVPIPLPPTEPKSAWLRALWKNWGQVTETKAMYHYLSAVMAPGDREYLLAEMIERMLKDTEGP